MFKNGGSRLAARGGLLAKGIVTPRFVEKLEPPAGGAAGPAEKA
jgi:hypothetical protein